MIGIVGMRLVDSHVGIPVGVRDLHEAVHHAAGEAFDLDGAIGIGRESAVRVEGAHVEHGSIHCDVGPARSAVIRGLELEREAGGESRTAFHVGLEHLDSQRICRRIDDGT